MFSWRKARRNGFDLIVIGGGSAAFAAAIRAAELGASVAIAEEEVIGGTCVNRGCVPTKNLLYAAERYRLYAQNSFPGLPVGREPASFPEVIRQKDELVQQMRKSKYWDILEAYPEIKYYPKRARFKSPYEVELGDEVIGADKFIVATGASPKVIPIAGLDRVHFLTYKTALELRSLPTSMIVIGAGAIGLELGQMFSRFGSRITILEALPRIAPTEEQEISETLESCLEEEGIEIWTNVGVASVRPEDGNVLVVAQAGEQFKEFRAEKLLLAAGLRPNTSGLNLEAAGVELDEKGAIKVNEELRTTARHIWAAGDVIGNPMLVTVAALQGGIAAENALRGAGKKIDLSAVPHAIFTDPEVASVGLRQSEAIAKGFKVQVASIPFSLVPKAGAIRDTRGLMRMVVDASSYRILGVHLVARHAADLIHMGVLAVKHKLTVGDIIRTTFVYPTLSEVYKIAALSFKKDVTKLSCCAQ